MYLTRDGVELYDTHWYTTSLVPRGAHCTPDGRAVGIFCAPERPLVPTVGPDGAIVMQRGPKLPARLVIQAPDGHDLVEWDLSNPHQPKQQIAAFALADLPDIAPLVEADHLPEARRAHLPAGLKLDDPEALGLAPAAAVVTVQPGVEAHADDVKGD